MPRQLCLLSVEYPYLLKICSIWWWLLSNLPYSNCLLKYCRRQFADRPQQCVHPYDIMGYRSCFYHLLHNCLALMQSVVILCGTKQSKLIVPKPSRVGDGLVWCPLHKINSCSTTKNQLAFLLRHHWYPKALATLKDGLFRMAGLLHIWETKPQLLDLL